MVVVTSPDSSRRGAIPLYHLPEARPGQIGEQTATLCGTLSTSLRSLHGAAGCHVADWMLREHQEKKAASSAEGMSKWKH
jgi:hypothetical protein